MEDKRDQAHEQQKPVAPREMNRDDDQATGVGTSGGNAGAGRSGKDGMGSEKPSDNERMGSQKPGESE